MFERILGNFFIHNGYLNENDLERVLSKLDTSRAKLGTIAISEHLMSIEDAEEVNRLQAGLNKRFGDIAIEKGLLTADQIEHLLSLQGNSYLVFLQLLQEDGLMDMSAIREAAEEYKHTENLSDEDIEELKSGDMDRMVPVLLHIDNGIVRRLLTIGVRTAYRLMDRNILISEIKRVSEITVPVLSLQHIYGMHKIMTGFAGTPETMEKVGKAFAGDSNVDNPEDGLDAICEFLNCVNGFLAIEYSLIPVDLDMAPPIYYQNEVKLSGPDIYVLPLTLCGEQISYITAIDSEVLIAQR